MGERASDDDRQRVVAELERHTGDGRLSLDEFSSRVDRVYQAITHADLTDITRDLPAPVRPRNDHWHLMLAMAVAVVTLAGLALSLRFW
jgi:Domain of unknown function (DUF1707)